MATETRNIVYEKFLYNESGSYVAGKVDYEDATWGYIAAEYQEKVSDEDLSKYSEFDKSMIEDTNFRLVNLEFGEA